MGDIIAKADGTMQCVEPANKSDYTRDELQRIVGGNIEIIDLGKRYLVVNLVVDEDGTCRVSSLRYNKIATNWMHLGIGGYDIIVGDALLCEKEHIK